MRNENKIFSIAFDGAHHSGKGTQIEILRTKLLECGIPCISIKGEGYRLGQGGSEEDPESDFWQKMSTQLRKGADLQLWEAASYRLARELIVWRDRILRMEIEKILAPFGVLLIDRSFISKSILKSLQVETTPGKIFSSDELYPELIQAHKKITVEMVLPDLIFELIAPKDILLTRLDPNETDYHFRKTNIEDRYQFYLDAKQHLPEEIKNRIISIDSSPEKEEVYRAILEEIKKRYPDFRVLE